MLCQKENLAGYKSTGREKAVFTNKIYISSAQAFLMVAGTLASSFL